MRIDLNLAKEPSRNRSIFWLATAACYLVAFVALVLVLSRSASVGADTETLKVEADKQTKTIEQLEQQLEEIRKQKSEAVFTPADRAALDEARVLINQKSFSWTRLFNDIEPFVPNDARLTAISVNGIEGEGAGRVVSMTIQGAGRSFDQMGQFIASLDKSGGRFSAEPISTSPNDSQTEYSFTISVRYRPGIGASRVETEGADG
jgi:Tfp pilus assembly protein PilN